MQQFNKIKHYMVLRSSIFVGVFFLLTLPVIVKAQSNSSPYSIVGIGNIQTSSYDAYTGMGGSCIALSNTKYINAANDASLSKLNNHVFTFELAVRSSLVGYSGGNLVAYTPNQKAPSPTFDLAFRRLSIATKITNHWGLSLGLRPYSTANYDYTADKLVQGNNQSTLLGEYHGTGGLNQLYLGNGYQITRNTSLGVNTSVVWGSLKQTETLLSTAALGGLITENYIYLSGGYFNFSLQTKKRLSHQWVSSYGVTYSPKTTLHASYSVTVTDAFSDTLKNDPLQNDRYTIPGLLKLGIAFVKNDKYTFTINAQEQDWSTVKPNAFQQVAAGSYKLVNSNKLSLGYQKSNRLRNIYGIEYEQSFFQLGLYGANTYLQILGNQVTDFGVTMGYGRNSKHNGLGYYLGFEAGRRGSWDSQVLSENYFNLNLVFSYSDRWMKGRKYY
jgi:hypothetical protein